MILVDLVKAKVYLMMPGLRRVATRLVGNR